MTKSAAENDEKKRERKILPGTFFLGVYKRFEEMMKTVIYLSFVTASISFTVTETKLFKPLREWPQKKIPFLRNLFSCGYCFGHWVTFGLVALYKPKLFEFWRLLDYFFTALVIARLSGIQWASMCWLMDKAGK